jgi:hypothetical protein
VAAETCAIPPFSNPNAASFITRVIVVIRVGRRAEIPRARYYAGLLEEHWKERYRRHGCRRPVPELGVDVPRRLVAPRLRPDIYCLVPAPDAVAMDMIRVEVYRRYNAV